MMDYRTSNNACIEPVPVEKGASIGETLEILKKISIEMSVALSELTKRMTGGNGPEQREFSPAPLLDSLCMLRENNSACLDGLRYLLDVMGQ